MELKKKQGLKQIHVYHSLEAVRYKLIATTRLGVEKEAMASRTAMIASDANELQFSMKAEER